MCKKKQSSLVRINKQKTVQQNTPSIPDPTPPPTPSPQPTQDPFVCGDGGFDGTRFYILKNGSKTFLKYKYTPKTKEALIKLLGAKTALKEINTYYITDISSLFKGRNNYNFEGIENWLVCQVINMAEMLAGCTNFNQDIGLWNVSQVRDMNQMFRNCSSFNQTISWDISNVDYMYWMFSGCTKFNQRSIRMECQQRNGYEGDV